MGPRSGPTRCEYTIHNQLIGTTTRGSMHIFIFIWFIYDWRGLTKSSEASYETLVVLPPVKKSSVVARSHFVSRSGTNLVAQRDPVGVICDMR